MKSALLGRNQMKKSILTIAIALACIFGAQQASAKSSHKHQTKTSMNKKHHKKQVKKTAAATPAAPTAAQAVS
jgi:hypothetical protein